MAHIPRIFTESDLSTEALIILPDAQSKYLTRVMRLTTGAAVRVFNGRDGEWHCLLQVSGKSAELRAIRQTRVQYTPPDLTLLFAPLKKARTDYVVEKASELGVCKIQPVITEFTQTSRVRTEKLQAVAVEAAEQTERLDVPKVSAVAQLSSVLSQWPHDCPLIYCDEAGDPTVLSGMETGQAGGILVGPEGGFSMRERQMLHSLDFVMPITLGPRILRAETAVVAALTLWQSTLGDWHERPYVPET